MLCAQLQKKKEKAQKTNQNIIQRQSFSKSSQFDIKQGSEEIYSGFSPCQQFIIRLSSRQRANISDLQIMPFVWHEVLKISEQVSFCDLLSVHLMACYSTLLISHDTSACLYFKNVDKWEGAQRKATETRDLKDNTLEKIKKQFLFLNTILLLSLRTAGIGRGGKS